MNKTIIDYHVIYANESMEISDKVNRQIERGWVPFGAIGVTSACGPSGEWNVLYAQTMVMYSDDEDDLDGDET